MLKLIATLALVMAIGAGTYALAGDTDTRAKDKNGETRANRGEDAREGQGPPPWAKAHGWRCKQAGDQPGSPAFKDCIKAKKR